MKKILVVVLQYILYLQSFQLYLSCVFPFVSTDIFSADVCGPDKELDLETCQCVCQRKDPTRDCGPNRHLDLNTCQCVCNTLPAPSCPLNHVFNKDTCQCLCSKTCPRHQPLNKTKCSCECNESPNKCFLKGRRFHQATCRWGRGAVYVLHEYSVYYSSSSGINFF